MTIRNRTTKARRADRPQAGCGVLKGRNPCYQPHSGWNPERVTEQTWESAAPSGLGWHVHIRGFVHCVHSTPCLWSVSPSGFGGTIADSHLRKNFQDKRRIERKTVRLC
ncbi:MAG: hypothetical protein IJV33_04190 [Bacteroidaceae bacterium]|nr:hypothetical protein [Bacteroidaceae bacterium]